MCHQGIGGPYRYCEPVKCSWKYCVFYVFFVGVLHYLCFVFAVVKKYTANNFFIKIRQLFLGSFRYFSPKYDVVTASYVFFCVIGSFRVPSCWHTLRFCPNLVMPLGHQKGRTFWWLTRILKTQRDKKDYFIYVHVTCNLVNALFKYWHIELLYNLPM